MSYINDALQKAQKENKSGYAPYGQIISTSARKDPRPARRILLAGVLILTALIALTAALLSGPADKKDSAARQRSALVATRQLPPVAGAPVTAAKQGSLPAALEAQPARAKPTVLPTPPKSAPDNVAKVSAGVAQKTKGEPPVPPVKERQADIDYPAMFAQAVKKQSEGELMEARELYRKVIKNDPRNVQALNNLGVIYMSIKNYRRAALRFNDALAVKPDYADVHYNLACLYSQTRDFARSFHYLQTAIGLNPEVRQWAKNDRDLQKMNELPDFHKLIEETGN